MFELTAGENLNKLKVTNKWKFALTNLSKYFKQTFK